MEKTASDNQQQQEATIQRQKELYAAYLRHLNAGGKSTWPMDTFLQKLSAEDRKLLHDALPKELSDDQIQRGLLKATTPKS